MRVIVILPVAKSFVTKLVHFHAQSALDFRGEIIQTTRLAIYCNYLLKK